MNYPDKILTCDEVMAWYDENPVEAIAYQDSIFGDLKKISNKLDCPHYCNFNKTYACTPEGLTIEVENPHISHKIGF